MLCPLCKGSKNLLISAKPFMTRKCGVCNGKGVFPHDPFLIERHGYAPAIAHIHSLKKRKPKNK